MLMLLIVTLKYEVYLFLLHTAKKPGGGLEVCGSWLYNLIYMVRIAYRLID